MTADDHAPLQPAGDDGTRRAALRAARPYRRAAIAMSIASVVVPYLDPRLWILLLPTNLAALIVNGIGRRRARRVAGIDPGGGSGDAVAKQVLVIGGTFAMSAAIMAVLIGMVLIVVVSALGALFDGCHCDQIYSLGIPK